MSRNRNKDLLVSKERAKYAQIYKQSIVSEQFRLLRSSITFSRIGKDIQTLLVTSPNHGDGKTTTAANLGIVLAQHDKKVIVIDADLRRPKIHELFDLKQSDGLTAILAGKAKIDEAICISDIPNLHIIQSGAVTKTSYELLTANRIEDIISILSQQYDTIIFDTSPILYTAETQILANLCEASILVVKSGQTLKEDARKAVNVLQDSKAELLGASLNGNPIKPKAYQYN